MSFQDVRGEGFGAVGRRREPGPVIGTTAGGGGAGGAAGAGEDSAAPGRGGAYHGPANALLQYQQQVTLYEQLRRLLGGPRDKEELRIQLATQETVVKVRVCCLEVVSLSMLPLKWYQWGQWEARRS